MFSFWYVGAVATKENHMTKKNMLWLLAASSSLSGGTRETKNSTKTQESQRPLCLSLFHRAFIVTST